MFLLFEEIFIVGLYSMLHVSPAVDFILNDVIDMKTKQQTSSPTFSINPNNGFVGSKQS
jgi:hypothetical protein